MKIIFNLTNVGLGNNGGSHTIVQSANTLQDLGNKVYIVGQGSPMYSWDKINVEYINTNNVDNVQADVIIGTGTKSFESTNKSKIKNKFLWIRGYEIWNVPEKVFVDLIKSSPAKKIVNSVGLKNKLFEIETTILRPGHDFNDFTFLNIRKNNKKVIIGGLYNSGKKRQHKRTEWIFKAYEYLKNKYDIELYMFGSDGTPENLTTFYVKNPDIKTKNKPYNMIDVWLAPSELEGLHIAPAEAMLTQCAVVSTNAELAGTCDYLTNDFNGFSSENNFESFLACVEILIKHKNIRKEFGINARQTILLMGDRKTNMKKFVEYLSKEIK